MRRSLPRSVRSLPSALPFAHSVPVLLLLLLLFFAASTLGCARGESAEERQIDELRDELARVQSESDRVEERLGKLEVDSADVNPAGLSGSGGNSGTGAHGTTRQPARALSAPVATPALRVVHLDPDGSEEAGEAGETAAAVSGPEAAEPPLRIQGSGSEATIITEKGERRRVQDGAPAGSGASTDYFTNANLGPSIASHSAGRPSALDEEAKHSYDAALVLVNGKHYPEALEALAGFLVRWPDHPNADNAMYWRGECYFAQGDFTNAAKEFEGLLARFPMGNKAPDALLKLGISEQRLGDAALARQRFDRLRRDFPRSNAAKHIPDGAQTVRPSTPRSAPGEKP